MCVVNVLILLGLAANSALAVVGCANDIILEWVPRLCYCGIAAGALAIIRGRNRIYGLIGTLISISLLFVAPLFRM